ASAAAAGNASPKDGDERADSGCCAVSCATLAHPSGLARPERARQRSIGLRERADAPEERIGLQPCAAAGRARRVRPVLRQQNADVHLVGFRLEPVEEPPDAVPLRLPLAGPVVAALDDPAALR